MERRSRRPMEHRRSAFAVWLLALSSAWYGWGSPLHGASEPHAGYAWVVFGSDTIRAEVARTDRERELGLMHRDSVPEGTGMLFVFERAEIQGVWMKDTHVPLDVAFLDARFRVLSIEHLEPLDLTVRWSTSPVSFALEVRRGWFADHDVGVGDRAEIVFDDR